MIECQKSRFFLREDEHYLNCAYMSPTTKEIERVAVDALRRMRRPSSITVDMFFRTADDVRRAFATIVNAADPASIAILPSVSYGVATVARNVPVGPSQRIVLVEEQFPSNVYSWRRLANDRRALITTVACPPGADRRSEILNERILDSIDEETAVVAVPHVHWTDGTRLDLDRIGARAREVGAVFVIDGSQSVGAAPMDVQRFKPDALICAGYKWLFGPYGISLGYFGPRLMDGVPLEENWITREGSEQFSQLVNYRDGYQPGAIRYDVGERSNFVLLPMMLAGLKHVLDWKPECVQAYCAGLFEPALADLAELGYHIVTKDGRFAHLVGIRLPEGFRADTVGTTLAARGIQVSVRGTAIRVSPHVYNDNRDVDALVDALHTVYRHE